MGEKKYITARKIAMGGMAEVLLAAQTSDGHFEKLVVLKRVLQHLREDGQFVQMFLNEARVAALLKHPNIVRVYDIDRWSDELTVVMEYLSGEDLRYIIGQLRAQQQLMDVAVACRILADTAKALHFAHTATDLNGKPMRVIHRDIAPSNLFLTYDGVVKILDFGIAKASTQMSYTVPGTVKGKFAYMSPESIRQDPIDPRSDIFSLGIVMWEMLAARRLFTGKNDAAVLRDVLEYEIPPPSIHNSAVPPELDGAVLRCLARDPARRFADAGELAEVLEDTLTRQGISMPPREVGNWLRELVPWRHHERKQLERKVAKRAVEGEMASDEDLVTRDNVPSLFPRSALPSSSGVGSTSAGPIPNYESQRSKGLVVGAAVLGLLALGLVGVAVSLFLSGKQRPAVAAPPPALAPQSTARLVVHVSPPGCALSVDGRMLTSSVGASGHAVEAKEGQRLDILLTKPGYQQKHVQVVSRAGSRHVYYNLSRLKERVAK